jgi:phosphatidylserine/phosphatidylglycerophosphate/cardiolipin synthase-like enzyme
MSSLNKRSLVRIALATILCTLYAVKLFATTMPYFSPYDDCQGVILANLHSAQKSVLVSCYGLSDRRIADELIALHRRGVKVRICVDRSRSRSRLDQTRRLAADGIDIVVKPVSRLEHNKFLVIDHLVVITGSYNLSKSASKQDNNLIVITEEPKAVESYVVAWVRIYNRDRRGRSRSARYHRKEREKEDYARERRSSRSEHIPAKTG